MNPTTSIPTQPQSTQLPAPVSTPQTIQIQLPAEMVHTPAPTPTVPGDITSSLMLIAFAIVVKVTMEYLKPEK